MIDLPLKIPLAEMNIPSNEENITENLVPPIKAMNGLLDTVYFSDDDSDGGGLNLQMSEDEGRPSQVNSSLHWDSDSVDDFDDEVQKLEDVLANYDTQDSLSKSLDNSEEAELKPKTEKPTAPSPCSQSGDLESDSGSESVGLLLCEVVDKVCSSEVPFKNGSEVEQITVLSSCDNAAIESKPLDTKLIINSSLDSDNSLSIPYPAISNASKFVCSNGYSGSDGISFTKNDVSDNVAVSEKNGVLEQAVSNTAEDKVQPTNKVAVSFVHVLHSGTKNVGSPTAINDTAIAVGTSSIGLGISERLISSLKTPIVSATYGSFTGSEKPKAFGNLLPSHAANSTYSLIHQNGIVLPLKRTADNSLDDSSVEKRPKILLQTNCLYPLKNGLLAAAQRKNAEQQEKREEFHKRLQSALNSEVPRCLDQHGRIEVKKVKISANIASICDDAGIDTSSIERMSPDPSEPQVNSAFKKMFLQGPLPHHLLASRIPIIPEVPKAVPVTEVGNPAPSVPFSEVGNSAPIVPVSVTSKVVPAKLVRAVKRMSRKQLEELVVRKFNQSITDRSEIGKLNQTVVHQTTQVDKWKKKSSSFQKQLSDLNLVVKKYLNDLKLKKPAIPQKVTRTVALQVQHSPMNPKRFKDPHTSINEPDNVTNSVVNQQVAAPAVRKNKPGPASKKSPIQPSLSRPGPASRKLAGSVQNAVAKQQQSAPTRQVVVVPNSTIRSPQKPDLSAAENKESAPPSSGGGLIDLTDDEEIRRSGVVAGKPQQLVNGRLVVGQVQLPRGPVVSSQSLSYFLAQKTATTPLVVASNASGQFRSLLTTTVPGGQPQEIQALIIRGGNPVTSAGVMQAAIPNQVAKRFVGPNGIYRASRPNVHPAPLPSSPPVASNPEWRLTPPKPTLKLSKVVNGKGIILSWNLTITASHADVRCYQLYAYQENRLPPTASLWKLVGEVRALPLPMACTLTQFMEGHRYHFTVRATDIHSRCGPFSTPSSIFLDKD